MIAPGETIGILGGGQLGRMTGLAARALGYRVGILEPDPACAAAGVADWVLAAPYEDPEALREFSARSAVLTFEFENVPAGALRAGIEPGRLRPGVDLLEVSQDRLREKRALEAAGLPLPKYAAVGHPDDLEAAAVLTGTPAVLKTTRFGYDGKGQCRLGGSRDKDPSGWEAAERLAATTPCVLEEWVNHCGEYSVLVARTARGESIVYPLFENIHRNQILDVTRFPAGLPEGSVREAQDLALHFAESTGLEGLLVIELFRDQRGRWLANEIAPRPHNSAHITQNAAAVSQFEQHVRAVCDLPIGKDLLVRPGIMVNILGDCWDRGTPNWESLLRVPGSSLHLYDKGEPRRGRKMGHCNLVAAEAGDLVERLRRVREILGQPPVEWS